MVKSLVLALAYGIILAPLAASAAVVSLDFNGSDTFAPNFNTFENGGNPGDVVWSASGGVGGSGGLIAPNGGGFDRSAVYKTAGFDLTTGTTTISMFVKDSVTADGNSRPIQLGFINGPTLTFNGNAGTNFLSIRIRGDMTAQLQYAVNGTTFTDSAVAFTITSGDWLKLRIDFALTDAVAGTVTYSYLVDDYGANGTAPPVNIANSGTRTFTNAAFAGSGLANMYGGFRSNASENPGFDNFTVVPEPGSLTLLGFAGVAVALRRRRA
jgi:hypothetical protein